MTLVDDERWRAAHRAVLDHLVRLIAESPLGDDLVLRGSMVMSAWVGAEAREPADLDWVVPQSLLVPIDPEHPYPYVDELQIVQQWPEAADGADQYEMWKFEEFDTGGFRPVVPPEGLRWITEPEPDVWPPREELLDVVGEQPVVAPGVVLDVEAAWDDDTWTYSEYDAPGSRLIIPWEVEGLPGGEVQLDFARDERLPEAPVLTAIPRADGAGHTVVRTAGRELSLAWKLRWLHTDHATVGRAQGKDLYDAVVLAESEATRLSLPLLHKVFRQEPGDATAGDALHSDAMARWSVDWEDFRADYPGVRGTAEEWLRRLIRAVEPVFADRARRM